MANYTVIQFDVNSKSFAGRIAIQETDENGSLTGIYNFDGDTLTKAGGPSASWDALLELEATDYEEALSEVSEESVRELLGGRFNTGEYEQQLLSIGSEFLPPVAIAARECQDLFEEEQNQYWAFVYAQVKSEAEMH
jgi:hypothetical protein